MLTGVSSSYKLYLNLIVDYTKKQSKIVTFNMFVFLVHNISYINFS